MHLSKHALRRPKLVTSFGQGDTTFFDQRKGGWVKRVAKATPKWPQILKMDLFLLPAVEARIGQKEGFFENIGHFRVKMENGKTEGQGRKYIVIARRRHSC